MNKQAFASFYWLAPEEGGRKHLPSGTKYVTVARFQRYSGEFLPELWSLLLTSSEPLDSSRHLMVRVSFLAPENAPVDYLSRGMRFHLLEGERTVAIGVVMENDEPVTDIASVGATRQ